MWFDGRSPGRPDHPCNGTSGMGLANTVFGACEASDMGTGRIQSLLASRLLNVPM